MFNLIWDRGTEFAKKKRFTVEKVDSLYFCDPQSLWQRGTNENMNGLLRQYFSKGTDLSPFKQLQLDAIALKLNTRARKTLQYETPSARLATSAPLT
jgi:IS30 family transposase